MISSFENGPFYEQNFMDEFWKKKKKRKKEDSPLQNVIDDFKGRKIRDRFPSFCIFEFRGDFFFFVMKENV